MLSGWLHVKRPLTPLICIEHGTWVVLHGHAIVRSPPLTLRSR